MPILVLTPGDPEGIGPEITWKALRNPEFAQAPILCVGAREPFEKLGAPIIEVTSADLRKGLRRPQATQPYVWLLPAPTQAPKAKRRRLLPGYQCGWSIETATRLVLEGQASAIVTGPISKERLQAGGFNYPGHTEFLAKLCRTRHVTMMLANSQLRVTLATIHVALKDVPRTLTRERLRRTIEHTAKYLREWWGIAVPRIGVAGLNPHAGEKGIFGKEEQRVITPELEKLRKRLKGQCEILGPLPADTLFANHVMAPPPEKFDAVVCMYHDQGLIPVKLLDFPGTVNITLGLPIVRTSVDHGVGFDIVGKGTADPSSLQAAIRLAQKIAPSTLRGEKLR